MRPDPFEAWLATLPARGYDRDWIRRNSNALRQRFEAGTDMPPCPEAAPVTRDRYEGLF